MTRSALDTGCWEEKWLFVTDIMEENKQPEPEASIKGHQIVAAKYGAPERKG